VDYGLNYSPPTSTKALLPLDYITFCVFPLHLSFLYLVLPPPNCGRARPSPGRSYWSPAGYATASAGRSRPLGSHTTAPAGRSLLRHTATEPRPAAASHAMTPVSCAPAVPRSRPGYTKAVVGHRRLQQDRGWPCPTTLAPPRSWLVHPTKW
jgi:hypothetical protein